MGFPAITPPPPTSLDPPPARENTTRKVRRWYRTRKSFSGLTQWFIDFGLIIIALLGLIFFLGTYKHSLNTAYSVMVGEGKPWEDKGSIFPTWTLSLIGWLAIPAIIGGTAGYIIHKRIDGYIHAVTARTYHSRWSRFKDKIKIPPRIPWLGDWHTHPHHYKREFVDKFVRVAHRNDWSKAQNHWELAVSAYLSTHASSDMTRGHRYSAAQGATRNVLYSAARRGKCPVCRARKSSP